MSFATCISKLLSLSLSLSLIAAPAIAEKLSCPYTAYKSLYILRGKSMVRRPIAPAPDGFSARENNPYTHRRRKYIYTCNEVCSRCQRPTATMTFPPRRRASALSLHITNARQPALVKIQRRKVYFPAVERKRRAAVPYTHTYRWTERRGLPIPQR